MRLRLLDAAAGFGALSGMCGVLHDVDLTGATPNAGGSSGVSEAFAYEELARCEGATLLATETEIVDDGPGEITDLEVMIGTHEIGVSVTRAVAFSFGDPYTVDDATTRRRDDAHRSRAVRGSRSRPRTSTPWTSGTSSSSPSWPTTRTRRVTSRRSRAGRSTSPGCRSAS